jgi:Fe-S-cluster containining protein
MRPYYRSFGETKQQYQEIFSLARRQLYQTLAGLREGFFCSVCQSHAGPDADTWFQPLPPNCQYRAWQREALSWLENVLGRELLIKLQQIEGYRQAFTCHQCGVCCRLASSEHDYEALCKKASAGDTFAVQFTSIFLPYASREAARAKFPDVVQAVLKEAGEPAGEERVFFYHCPYVGEDNRCTIYGTAKRPAICGSYPETPLSFVYEKCAWRPWKEETHQDALAVHATLELAQELAKRLQQSLS